MDNRSLSIRRFRRGSGRLILLLVFILLVAILGIADRPRGMAETEVIALGTSRYVFLDDTLLDRTLSQNVRPVVNPPVITGRVIVPDQPWEVMGYHYYSQVMPYGRAYEGHIYNYILYYGRLNSLSNKESGQAGNGLYCVALSDDGINWIKPLFSGSFLFDEQPTNCIYDEPSQFLNFVFFDPIAPETSRYKAITYLSDGTFGVLGVSTDGLVFQPVSKRLGPVHQDGTIYHLDSQNVVWWDAAAGAYRFLVRGRRADFDGTKWSNPHRNVHYGSIATTDLLAADAFILNVSDNPNPYPHWTQGPYTSGPMYAITTELPTVMEAGEADWRTWQQAEPYSVDIYHTAAMPYPWAPETYLSFPTLYYHYTAATTPAALTQNDGEFAVGLATSRDGYHWRRYRQADGFPAYVARGPVEGLNLFMMSMGHGMIRVGDELYQYFIGLPRTHGHGAYFDGRYQRITASPENIQRWQASDKGGIYRLRQRVDGFVAMATCGNEGVLVTKPYTFTGDELTLNFVTAADGYVDVSLLDESGQVLPGFEPVRMQGDAVDGVVTWPGANIADLASQPVRLSLRLRQANVFAFAFRQAGVQDQHMSAVLAPNEPPLPSRVLEPNCASFPGVYQTPTPTPTTTATPAWQRITFSCRPNPAPEVVSTDGYVERGAAGSSFDTLRNGAGTHASSTVSSERIAWLAADSVLNTFKHLRRGILTCDTSAVPASATVLEARLFLYGKGKSNGLGRSDLVVVSANPQRPHAVLSG
ncbi:MAG: hypothetical protein N2383_12370, partial [Caldilineales bacterium]|nr:hypothetical protein [Caldilineales bacterium]